MPADGEVTPITAIARPRSHWHPHHQWGARRQSCRLRRWPRNHPARSGGSEGRCCGV